MSATNVSCATIDWCDEEISKRWFNAHHMAAEKKPAETLAELILLLIAARIGNAADVLQLHRRLQEQQSPIRLLASRTSDRCALPLVNANDELVFAKTQHQIFVHLGTKADYDDVVRKEWKTSEQHERALANSGLLEQ